MPYFWSEKGYILTKIPVASAILGLFGFILFTKKTVKKIYERKNALAFVYPCKIRAYGREMETDCFVDSGNLAKVGEVPLCFVSMSLFFDLRFPLPQNEKKERIKIRTVDGEKWVEAYLAEELEIYLERGANRIEKVYFSPSSSLSGREYQVLVGAWAVSA